MATTYKKNIDLKDSNIEWVESIPRDWVSGKRAKFIFRSLKEVNKNMFCDNVLSLTMRGVISRSELGEGGLLPSDYSTFQVFYANDLVFKLIDLENYKTSRVGMVHEKGIMSSAYIRIFPIQKHNIVNKYFYYFYYNLYLQGIFNFIGMGVRSTMNAADLLELKVITPPTETQKRIVDFLDEKMVNIDVVIEKKQKLIKLLKEQRTAIITKAVTKGLDTKVKMKDSGVEWVGEMPAGWKTISLKKILEYIQPGKFITNAINKQKIDNTMVPVLTANKGFILGYTDETDNIFTKPLPVIIFDDFTTNKKFVDFPFKVRSSAIKILKQRLGNTDNIRFVFRNMEVLGLHVLEHNRHWIVIYSKEYIPLPGVYEQKEIADYLDKMTKKIDTTIKITVNQIKKIKEYQGSLIYNAITGKITI